MKKIVHFVSSIFFSFIFLVGTAHAERWTMSSDGLSAKTSGSSKSFNPNSTEPSGYSCELKLLNSDELGLYTVQTGIQNFTLTGSDQVISRRDGFFYKKINEKGLKNTLLEKNKSVIWTYKGMSRSSLNYQSGKTSEGLSEGFREEKSIAWSNNFNFQEVSNPCFSMIQYLPKGDSPLLRLAKEFNSKFAWYTR